MKKKGILEQLKEGPVLGDGGYLLELEKRGWVRAGPFTPEIALTYPDALRELHVEFREAGAEVLQALTFYASRDKLATVGLADRLERQERKADTHDRRNSRDHEALGQKLPDQPRPTRAQRAANREFMPARRSTR